MHINYIFYFINQQNIDFYNIFEILGDDKAISNNLISINMRNKIKYIIIKKIKKVKTLKDFQNI